MNRFELLELMYELVKENEALRRRCDKLEGRFSSPEREDTCYPPPARSRPEPMPEQKPERKKTKREESAGFSLLKKRKNEPEEEYWTEDDEHYRTRQKEVMQRMMEQTYSPSSTAWSPSSMKSAKASDARKPSTLSGTALQLKPEPARFVAAKPQTSRPAAQAVPQPQRPAAPARAQPQQPRAKPAEPDFDIDSILNEYLGDLSSDRSGGHP